MLNKLRLTSYRLTLDICVPLAFATCVTGPSRVNDETMRRLTKPEKTLFFTQNRHSQKNMTEVFRALMMAINKLKTKNKITVESAWVYLLLAKVLENRTKAAISTKLTFF